MSKNIESPTFVNLWQHPLPLSARFEYEESRKMDCTCYIDEFILFYFVYILLRELFL